MMRGRDVGDPAMPRRCWSAESAARLLWGNEDPIGRRGDSSALSRGRLAVEVVGIVGDVKGNKLAQKSAADRLPLRQGAPVRRGCRWAMRTASDPAAVTRSAVAAACTRSIRSCRCRKSGRWNRSSRRRWCRERFLRAPARDLRRGRTRARLGRHLQRVVVPGARTAARDRQPDGARRGDR